MKSTPQTKGKTRPLLLFGDVWEFLDFKRHGTEVSRTSSDGLLKACLKKDGNGFSYTLTLGQEAKIFATLQRFRATASRLREFHVGCAKTERDMKRYLRTRDPKWLKGSRPFGQLHGGIVLSDGGVVWRGDRDDIDPDEWIDSVQDESLAKLLGQVDSLRRDCSEEPDDDTKYRRAWELLETIPACHEDHVEVLRRRLICKPEDESEADLKRDARWARALAEAEPYNAMNWLSLGWAVETLEGEPAAVEVLREGIRRYGPDFTLYYSLASHLCSLARLDEAKEAMLLALQEDIFAFSSALESECFAPIWGYIEELKQSDWFQKEKERLEARYPSEPFSL
jgi:tetratricopeptide (TPR) repeat protein